MITNHTEAGLRALKKLELHQLIAALGEEIAQVATAKKVNNREDKLIALYKQRRLAVVELLRRPTNDN